MKGALIYLAIMILFFAITKRVSILLDERERSNDARKRFKDLMDEE